MSSLVEEEDVEFNANTTNFLTWIAGLGIRLSSKIAISDSRAEGRGRSCVAVADLDEDEVIFSIPRESVLNIDTTLQSFESKESKQSILNMPSWLALTALMISESLLPTSKWTPYFAVLPRQLNSLVFWSESELAELQASTVLDKIGKQKAEEAFSQHLAPLGLRNCDVETCHRVASIIMAYAFDIPEDKTADENVNRSGEDEGEDLVSDDGEDEKTMLSMIPLADMLNADADRNNARLCCDNIELEMRAIKPIRKGEEIFNDYGQLPRSDLLRRYGYVTDQYALYDVAELCTNSILSAFRTQGILQIPGHHSPFICLPEQELDQRIELAEREGIYEESYDLCRVGMGGPSIPDELLALVYLLLLNQESYEAISHSQTALPNRSKLTTELVGQVLIVLLRWREKEYATTLEEDEELLNNGPLSTRKAMAIQVRQGEKTVLRDAIQEAASFTASNKRMVGTVSPNGQPEGNSKKRKAGDMQSSKKKGKSS